MKKIFLDLSGGIGNQLFEFCFARELANHLNCNVLINKRRFFRRNDNHKEYLFDLIDFKDENIYSSNSYFMALYVGFKWKIMILVDKIKKLDDDKVTFLNKAKYGYIYCLKSEQIIDSIDDIVVKHSFMPLLEGYYQWPKVMMNTIDWVKDNIHFKCSDDKQLSEIKNIIMSSNSVAVHVRRGDYVGLKHLQVCDYAYYSKAIELIKEKTNNPVFFIFSDDIEWVKNNYKFEGIYIIPSKSSVNDLFLMSLCKHFIISNSTFSWWGQELSRYNSKIVIAPNIWFNNNDITELYMDYFEIVKTGASYE